MGVFVTAIIWQEREQRASADTLACFVRWASSLVRPALISSEDKGLPPPLNPLTAHKTLKGEPPRLLPVSIRQTKSDHIQPTADLIHRSWEWGVLTPSIYWTLPAPRLSAGTAVTRNLSVLFSPLGAYIWQWDRTANKRCLLQHDGSPVTQRQLSFATTLFLKVGTF